LAAIVDSSDDAIIGKTLDGTITSWNRGAQRIYGYTADEVVGRPISILIPQDRPDELPTILARLSRGERIDHYLTKRVRKDGRSIDVSVTISPVKDETGRIVGASAIARDVSEQQAAIKEAFRLRDQFISVAAHELRTPMTTLYARLQLAERRLVRGDLAADVALRDIRLVREAADRLKSLVDRLLDVSRLESGQVELERADVDLAAIARSVASMTLQTSGREARVIGSASGVMARVDPVRIEEVLVNLLDNALKYSPADTPVDVEISAKDDSVRVAVRDRGPGVPPDQRERIFEPFRRASSSGPGVGLGLHISREITQLHGGTLTVESPTDGGSRFVVTLPKRAPGDS
jgi:PAS domain S-box-containing protein